MYESLYVPVGLQPYVKNSLNVLHVCASSHLKKLNN